MKKTNEFTPHVRYFMGWVAGYRLCGGEYIYKIPLTQRERERLTHRYNPEQDDHTRLFKTKEAAIAWLKKNMGEADGHFVRRYAYGTPTVKHAEEYCVARDEEGKLILWDDAGGSDYTEITKNEHSL